MKRYLYILSLLLSLSLVIILCGKLFDSNTLKSAYRSCGVEEFSEYSIQSGRYELIIPKGWSIQEELGVQKNYNSILIKDNKSINIDIKIFVDENNYNDFINCYENSNKVKRSVEKINGNEWSVLICESNEESKILYYRSNNKDFFVINISYNKDQYNESIKTIFEKLIGSI